MNRSYPVVASILALILPLVAGCSAGDAGQQKGFHIVTSTPIMADLARAVAGDRAQVTSLIPAGADPHTYEPSLRNVRDIAYADVAFTNGLLLEQQKLVRTIDANLPAGATSVAVAEKIESYGGTLLPLVEDASLDSIWLGLRTSGSPKDLDLARDASVAFRASRAQGPGQLAAFITGTFGSVEMVADSTHMEASDENRQLETTLPLQAHTHLSWSYAEPGIYELDLEASAHTAQGESLTGLKEVPATTIHFAVGVDPQELAQQLQEQTGSPVTVLNNGHADLNADLATGTLTIRTDSDGQIENHDPATTVIAVPSRTLQEVPAGSQYRFLGKPGTKVYLLAQAVLGKHVHGEIDPHIWHSVPNAMAAVELMRDTLSTADPSGASTYRANAHALLEELSSTHQELTAIYGGLNSSQTNLVTTHDGYRYLASTYGLTVAGYVSAGPGVEPSIQQRERLRRTITDLGVPALYTEHKNLTRTPVLQQVSEELGVKVCELYSDTIDSAAPTYSHMMLKNAHTIAQCSARS
ncbi:anchored repeat ABC transporter, substrate-binding protein [Rothia sp. P4278]|uniref:anchored repeat ABC transporter, substrate-binding protein n=1 Tax=Rothia sp. P4278 TaxID=3402658 RepID=UPI003AE5D5C0